MFTLGQDLYRPTLRDEQTLLIEPFWRQFTGSGSTTVLAFFVDLPRDRALFIQRFVLEGQAAVGELWTRIEVNANFNTLTHRLWSARNGNIGDGLIGNDAGATPNAIYYTDVPLEVVCPPFTERIQVNATKSAAGAGTISCFITGYLIPPGGIGRI